MPSVRKARFGIAWLFVLLSACSGAKAGSGIDDAGPADAAMPGTPDAAPDAGAPDAGPTSVPCVATGGIVTLTRGPVRLDEMRNPVHNVYIRMVRKKKEHGYDKEELWNAVIKTYPNVSQFWTYDPNRYIANPSYSRDYPPATYLGQ